MQTWIDTQEYIGLHVLIIVSITCITHFQITVINLMCDNWICILFQSVLYTDTELLLLLSDSSNKLTIISYIKFRQSVPLIFSWSGLQMHVDVSSVVHHAF